MQGGDHPQEDLTKFGYKAYMKVEKSENPLYFGYLLEPAGD
jgi:hypothetical protein